VRDKLLAAGLVPVGGTPEQFNRFIDSEIVKWTRTAKEVGATAD
jgi:tripartite-type tricarboxylate transporter receptor subunit TctC